MIRPDDLLSRLVKVRKGQSGQWTACCPAHNDRTPSLRITQRADGKISLHCFAGCHINDICEAIGIRVNDLYPNTSREQHEVLPERKRRNLRKALFDAQLYVEIARADLAKGRNITPFEAEKVLKANECIERIEGVLYD